MGVLVESECDFISPVRPISQPVHMFPSELITTKASGSVALTPVICLYLLAEIACHINSPIAAR